MARGVELGRPVSREIARRTAESEGWREKVLAYITRRPDELLVLEHSREYPDAGIQVPAGGVDEGEDPSAAVVREVFEETGLVLATPVYLESREWPTADPSRIRHYFWFAAPTDTPDRWQHVVSSGDGDDRMVFTLTFVNRSAVALIPGHGHESGLAALGSAVDEQARRADR